MTVQQTHFEIARLCGEVSDLFKPGSKITVVVRNPSADKEPHSAALTVGDDDIDQAIAALQYLKVRDEKRPV